ncbi:MAG: metal-dependent transcriptional regulator [Anaerolineales bacterium]|nr:MAG: metal-dependent transcriptional regulator [Anaerolineales bacterium]
MTTDSMEEYLETICKLSGEQSPVALSALADQLEISSVSANEMIKKLVARGLATYEPYKGVTLTAEGQTQALRVIRRHRLWERFLADVLGLPWDRVHEEACQLEHATSPLVEEKLAQFLDEPETCPHGYPVAGTDGGCEEEIPMSEMEPGQRAVVLRVAEHNADLLRYLAELELRPQAVIEIEEVAPFDGPLTVRIGESRRVIGRQVASQITVRRA